MNIRAAANAFALGNLLVEDLPAIAVRALEDGYDSEGLRRLAVVDRADGDQIRTLFRRAMPELGIDIPSPQDAGIFLARSIAREVIDGAITPYAGARRIWFDVYNRFPELDQLLAFVGLASEYEDDEDSREMYAQRIVAECRSLTSGDVEDPLAGPPDRAG